MQFDRFLKSACNASNNNTRKNLKVSNRGYVSVLSYLKMTILRSSINDHFRISYAESSLNHLGLTLNQHDY